jgi:superfamily II DNA/RNA helicase
VRILISTDVLSEGLNLQDANQIINYDLHWNPVRLMQRIGRVDRRMDPSKPVKYDSVRVFNFLPPKELDEVLGLYETITGKLIAINRTLGIEAPVLTAEDDFKAMDFFQNLGDSEISPQEQLRLVAHKLEQDHPEIWEEAANFPNRIYSGKRNANRLFLAYRVVTGRDPENENGILTDVRWFIVDREGNVSQDITEIHHALYCDEGARRVTAMPKEDRTRLRKLAEKLNAERRFKAQIPDTLPADELICWMEV